MDYIWQSKKQIKTLVMIEITDKETRKIIAVGEIIIDEKDYIKIHSSNKKYMKNQIIIQHVLMAILIIFTTIVSYGQTKIHFQINYNY